MWLRSRRKFLLQMVITPIYDILKVDFGEFRKRQYKDF